MTALQTLGTRLAALPERALSAAPSFSSSSLRVQRRSWAVGEILAAFGLGLALGLGVGLLLAAPSPDEAEAFSDDPGE